MGGQQSSGGQSSQRSDSPHRTGPSSSGNGVGAQHGHHQGQRQHQHQQAHEYSQTDGAPSRRPKTPQHPEHSQAEPGHPTNPDLASIAKIQKIQKDVLDLMDQVERFTGNTRKDRQYLYLDEMLTQNLLKLDTIDTDGKDNIKMARREAIKCIHKCISVLEAKADSGTQQSQQQRNAATAV